LIKTKEINYRGILKFRIPVNWVEEYDEEHGGSFYEDSLKSGTLRLKVISLKTFVDSSSLDATTILNEIIPKGSESTILPNKNAFKMFYEQTVDSGHEITIYYWSLVQYIKPNKVRLCNFSFTILTDRLGAKSIFKEIEFITEQIKSAEFTAY
tara:strand:- start:53649 stop:54107 length:459 start_codon:yes stop_codon:yes gene_type:complete